MIYCGDSREVLATLPAESVDAVVTDPPYELGFMGRAWDSSGIAYDVQLWRAVLRVLKPGGHLLAFGGTRTVHRIACAIEDAGFEIRDQLQWLYGQGFPKSLDVSKAIDASNRVGTPRARALQFTAWMRSTGLGSAQINALTRSNMASHYLTDREQPAVATAEMFNLLRPALADAGVTVPDYIEELVRWRTVESENLKRRQVVGQKVTKDCKLGRPGMPLQLAVPIVVDVTVPHTDAAARWAGWGTALKPANEPIVLARKPMVGTVADNVTEHGTGAINIDGCRIGTDVVVGGGGAAGGATWNEHNCGIAKAYDPRPVVGRWPSNVLLDPVAAAMLDAQSGDTSRFFYVAKPDTAERDAGLGAFAALQPHELVDRKADSAGMASPRAGAGRTAGRKNYHPTVKPIDLMRYLCRLVTPPGGTVLDPFAGSGTTGVAAVLEGFEFVGVELDGDHAVLADARVAAAARGDLFVDRTTDKVELRKPAAPTLQRGLFEEEL